MGFDDINREVQSSGAGWANLKKKGEVLKGKLVNAETRDQRFNDKPVVSQKTGKVRTEWVLTLETDDGTKKFGAKEGAKIAIGAALTTAGVTKMEAGGYLQLAVTEESVRGEKGQSFKAKYTPPVKTEDPWAGETDDSDEAPF